jgi:hypothetical protein
VEVLKINPRGVAAQKHRRNYAGERPSVSVSGQTAKKEKKAAKTGSAEPAGNPAKTPRMRIYRSLANLQ